MSHLQASQPLPNLSGHIEKEDRWDLKSWQVRSSSVFVERTWLPVDSPAGLGPSEMPHSVSPPWNTFSACDFHYRQNPLGSSTRWIRVPARTTASDTWTWQTLHRSAAHSTSNLDACGSLRVGPLQSWYAQQFFLRCRELQDIGRTTQAPHGKPVPECTPSHASILWSKKQIFPLLLKWSQPGSFVSLAVAQLQRWVTFLPVCSATLDSVTPWTRTQQAPLSMEFSRQFSPGVLLLEIFLTQGSNPLLLRGQADSLPLSYLGSPNISVVGSFLWMWPGENSVLLRPSAEYTQVIPVKAFP